MMNAIVHDQYTPSDYYHENTFSYYHYLSTKSHVHLPEQTPLSRQFSITSLLQKRPSLMMIGRKLSLFSRNRNKSRMTPTDLQRMDSLTTTSSSESSSRVSSYDEPQYTYLSVDLETALTSPSEKPVIPIDFSGKKYSNFYIKLPNGNWMVRIRDSNRKIIGTYEIDGSMI